MLQKHFLPIIITGSFGGVSSPQCVQTCASKCVFCCAKLCTSISINPRRFIAAGAGVTKGAFSMKSQPLQAIFLSAWLLLSMYRITASHKSILWDRITHAKFIMPNMYWSFARPRAHKGSQHHMAVKVKWLLFKPSLEVRWRVFGRATVCS